jgi:predicted solute-binding protein
MKLYTGTKLILSEKTFADFAAEHYSNPRLLDIEEFEEDLTRFRYLRRLFNKYSERNELHERLILNHLTIIHNVFDIEAATKMCFFKVHKDQWPALKTFLLYLNLLPRTSQYEALDIDLFVVKRLQQL